MTLRIDAEKDPSNYDEVVRNLPRPAPTPGRG